MMDVEYVQNPTRGTDGGSYKNFSASLNSSTLSNYPVTLHRYRMTSLLRHLMCWRSMTSRWGTSTTLKKIMKKQMSIWQSWGYPASPSGPLRLLSMTMLRRMGMMMRLKVWKKQTLFMAEMMLSVFVLFFSKLMPMSKNTQTSFSARKITTITMMGVSTKKEKFFFISIPSMISPNVQPISPKVSTHTISILHVCCSCSQCYQFISEGSGDFIIRSFLPLNSYSQPYLLKRQFFIYKPSCFVIVTFCVPKVFRNQQL